MSATQSRKTVVIVGAGFGGLRLARSLRRAPLKVVLVDRHNYHLFQPLLYQVATAGLSPAEIAHPVRAILRGQANLEFRLAEAQGVDLTGASCAPLPAPWRMITWCWRSARRPVTSACKM